MWTLRCLLELLQTYLASLSAGIPAAFVLAMSAVCMHELITSNIYFDAMLRAGNFACGHTVNSALALLNIQLCSFYNVV